MMRTVWIAASVALLLGLGLTAQATLWTWSYEKNQHTLSFDRLSWDHLAVVERTLDDHLHLMRTLRDFAAHDPKARPNDFQDFAGRLLSDYPALVSTSWSPGAAARPTTVAMADATSETAAREAFAKAVATGETVASPLVSLTGDRPGASPIKAILIHSPVYGARNGGEFQGMVSGILRLDILARYSMRTLKDLPTGHPMRLRIFDLSREAAPVPLFVAVHPEDRERPAPEALSSLRQEKTVTVGDRQWRLISVPAQAFFNAYPYWTYKVVAYGGLGMTLLLTVLVAMGGGALVDRRNNRIRLEQLVEERTRDLVATEAESRMLARQNDLLLQSVGEGIYGVDLHGVMTFANAAALRMVGFDLDELIGHNQHEKLHHTRRDGRPYPADECPIFASFRDGLTHCETDDVFWRKDGTSFPVEYVSAPIKDGDEVVGAVVVFRNVSEERRAEEARRRAEAELRVSTARLNLVIDTVKEGVCGFNDEGRIIFANRAAAELLGWPSPKEMQGKAVAEITKHRLADGRPCCEGICRIRLTLDDGETHRVSDEFFSGPDDRLFPVEYVVSPLIVSEVVVGAVVAFHDIGERKAMEKDLQRSNAELEQFAYVASHDLRQPLRMISSYLSMTQKHLGPQLDDETKTFIGFAVDGAKRMDRLILDLLEYSRTGQAARSEPVSLADAVADALDNLTVAIREADADVVVADGSPTVTGAPTELTRLFQNLIGNAVKYRAPERRPRIEIGWRHQGPQWLITIKDNGIGIAPEDRERAFAIFQRLVPKDAYEGTGIGLAICKKIVEQHGGQIGIESIPGEGSTFFFTLQDSPAVT